VRKAGSSTALTFRNVSLNDGEIIPALTNGSCSIINTYGLSGTCSYYSSKKLVQGVQMSLEGGQTFTQNTDASGNYSFSDIPGGTYKLNPTKSDQVGSAITAMDASFVLQAVVGLITLNSQSSPPAKPVVNSDSKQRPHSMARRLAKLCSDLASCL
jgi:hypothetical protein